MKPVPPGVFTGDPMTETDSNTLQPEHAQDHEAYMRAALEVAKRGMLAGEPPVGACLVAEDEIIAVLSNAVIGELDITAHAEMRVIREACQKLRRLNLKGCSLYVTVEPCLMCQSACHYAGIEQIVFGASIADMDVVTGNELSRAPANLKAISITGGCLADECRSLINEWAQ